jgi:nucleotide-binding universal stress UspA family protein
VARRRARAAHVQRYDRAILDDVVHLAALYDQKVTTAVRSDIAADQAVIAAAKEKERNLIVMGVGRRPGDRLFFGETAAGVFKETPISVLFVAS